MPKAKRIFIVADIKNKPIKVFVDQMPKLAKGFIRLGHDVRMFSYCNVLSQISSFKSRTLSKLFHKPRVDGLLAEQAKNYQPDIIYIDFPKFFDVDSVKRLREVAPNAVFIGNDGDPWPKLQGNRIETAKELDILMAIEEPIAAAKIFTLMFAIRIVIRRLFGLFNR